MPQLSPDQLEQISSRVAEYIEVQRRFYLPRSLPLAGAQRAHMEAFFQPELLASARMVVLKTERVQNPEFFADLHTMGFTDLPDFAHMAALTYNDVTVFHQGFTPRLLFHELVHLEQYRQLGVRRFAELYIRGFVEYGGYYNVPLEEHAYQLDARFAANPRTQFSVGDEVASRVASGGY